MANPFLRKTYGKERAEVAAGLELLKMELFLKKEVLISLQFMGTYQTA